MGKRQWLPLISIVLGVFIFNVSEFIPIGLLTDISSDFDISESSAGLIITIYAWAVAIMSLPIMLVLRRMEFRRMMLLCTSVFMFFQLMSGLSASFPMLVFSRLGVALSHAIFWSIAPNLAVRVVEERYQKVALSLVSAGTSIALVVGLPLGRVIGLAMGWRMAFVSITFASLLVLILLAIVFPRLENPGTFTLERLPEIYHNRTLVCIYAALVIFVTGCYTAYSYVEPFMIQIAEMNDALITAALIVFGCSGFIGGILFAKLYGRHRFLFLPMALAGVASALFVMSAFSNHTAAIFATCVVWGTCIACFNTSFQNETIWATPEDAGPIAMSLFSGIYNVGIGSGAVVGGYVIDHSTIGNIGYVGGTLALIAAAIVFLLLIPLLKQRTSAS